MSSYARSVLQCLGGASILAFSILATDAHAQRAEPQVEIDLPAQSLGVSLKALGIATRRNISGDGAIVGERQAPEVKGRFSATQALERLLRGSGLFYREVGDTLVVGPVLEHGSSSVGDGDNILVTGSRIRGAPVSSPVISASRDSLVASGIVRLADAMRSIPQNFGGGANPGIGFNVPSSSGADVGGTSTVNLRGLGSDATLTLVNGHRAAYNGSRQGIDISAVPMGIVEKIDVVPDGASAIYGSDAVAGVVNVILRRDYDGLELRADIGGATRGAGFRQQYGAVAGTRWGSGGIVGAYEFQKSGSIMSDQRDFTSSHPGLPLLPRQSRHAIVVNGHQEIAPGLRFAVDGLFNKRWNFMANTANDFGDLDISRTENHTTSRSLAVAPSLTLDLPGGWQAQLAGVYGNERLWANVYTFEGETRTSSAFVCYCNQLRSVEIAGDGPLFALPGGMARIATGVGYRDNIYKAYQRNVANAAASQDTYFAYAELNLPIIAPAQGLAGIDRLNLSGAVRYERYPGIGSIATPKFGLVYAPVQDVAFKASWGRSFRAPTMYQLHQVRIASLFNPASLGGNAGSAGSVLLLTGGNRQLKPERARSLSATIDFTPGFAPGLEVQLSYFSVRYTDRIVTPIPYRPQALSNPVFASYVIRSPDAAAIAQAVSGAGVFYNYTGRDYDPANVIAIVDNSNVNAGQQNLKGLDALVEYHTRIGEEGSLAFLLNASYLESRQKLTADAAETQLAGMIFNPPHWRGRASVTWSDASASFNFSANHIAGLDDARFTQRAEVAGMTTFDVTARYDLPAKTGALSGVSLSFTVQNMFDTRPPRILAPDPYDTPYDTTNYSAVGRFIGVGVAKSW